jgi:NAD+ synthase (glutamine-hydrolysing)
VPRVQLAEPAKNVERIAALAERAASAGADLVAFPELCLTGYTCDDLFHQDGLAQAVGIAIEELCARSAQLESLLIVGAPLRLREGLFNVALAIDRGRILGAVPKSYLPNYREFYEQRYFRSARQALCTEVDICGQRVPFGSALIFAAAGEEGAALHVEICEDLWVPIPPSSYAALAGANILVNISASNITVAKADYRRVLCGSHSARNIAASLYVSAGLGESTTDLAFDGHALIYENGVPLAESKRFAPDQQLTLADVDLGHLKADRMRMTSFAENASDHRELLARFRVLPWRMRDRSEELEALQERSRSRAKSSELVREVDRFPYVPHERSRRQERCEEVYSIQVRGLLTRLQATGIERIVVGVSGGLDSAHALMVAVRVIEELGLPRTNVLAYTMPGFGTSARTLANSRALMSALGVSADEIDIRPASERMLEAIGHPAGSGEPLYDTTYENVQAGERASHLFRLANHHRGLVLGTSDLSELALGWCTYGVGDQISHYAINASVPKTLIQFLIAWIIESGRSGPAAAALQDILDTEISPELIPTDSAMAGQSEPQGDSERIVGPYELVDFFLYHTLRFGYRPSKVAFLAHQAWSDRSRGHWPDLLPAERRREYTLAEIKHWLAIFLQRFFATSQFKRSAIPNAPKVGSGGALSPRGDWRAPSDAHATAWLAELAQNVPDED